MAPRFVGNKRLDTGNPEVEMTMALVEFDLWGKLWAPSSLTQFAALVQQEDLGPGDLSGWRGQSNASWPLHSSAFRRITTQRQGWVLDNAAVMEVAMRSYEDKLLDIARLAGHGHDQAGRDLSDLELLAKLQHHGAATRLVDFTGNALIALWFACRAHRDDWGIVFGARLEDVPRIGDKTSLARPVSQILDAADDGMTMWRPSALSPRIPAQAGFFVWSRVRDGCPWSSLGTSLPIEAPGVTISQLDEDFAAIAISPHLKGHMAMRWESVLGLTEQSLFPDFDGFAIANGATQSIYYAFWED